MLSFRLLEAIFRTVEALPSHSVQNLVAVLDTATDEGKGHSAKILTVLALPNERQVAQSLVDVWRTETPMLSPIAIASALQAASHTRVGMERAIKTEMVWTGPKSHQEFRRTDQALLQVIETAAKDLWLVTFAAYKQDQLRNAIERALARNVTVHFISESADESQGKVSHDGANVLSGMSGNLRVYLWPQEHREKDSMGRFGSLHAKCALADQSMLLVSSANLTENALQLNMEMGLLITGGNLPKQADQHLRQLIETGVLHRVVA